MEPSSLPWANKNSWHEEEIPIIIRSQNDGVHIQDIMQLQNLELKTLSCQVLDKLTFLRDPFVLSGCNMGIVGQNKGKSMMQSVN